MGGACSSNSETSESSTVKPMAIEAPDDMNGSHHSHSDQRRGSVTRRKVFSSSSLSERKQVAMPRKIEKIEGDRKIMRSIVREQTLLGASERLSSKSSST